MGQLIRSADDLVLGPGDGTSGDLIIKTNGTERGTLEDVVAALVRAGLMLPK